MSQWLWSRTQVPTPSRRRRAVQTVRTRDPELRLSRAFDAPRSRVWEAWTKADYVKRWFTPAPLTTPRCEVDLRPGGIFYLVMRMPDGVELPMDGRFVDVVPNERIVFTATIQGGVEVHTTVAFADEGGGKTRLDVHQVYSHETDATRGAPQGWAATLDQLAEVVRDIY